MLSPRNRALNWALWPEADRAAWSKAVSRPSFLGNAAPLAYWAPATQKAVLAGYAYWLSFLRRAFPEVLEIDLAQRVTAARVAAYSDYLAEHVRDQTRCLYIRDLYNACRSLDTETDWIWLYEFVELLYTDAGPPIDRYVHSSSKLFWLGIDLMDGADTRHLSGCVAYRDGLMISILAVRPVRLRNISGLRLGEQLVPIDGGYRLVYLAADVKNGKAQEFELPSLLVGYTDRYLAEVRPRFPGSAYHTVMWPSKAGGPLRKASIYHRVIKHTGERLGHPIGTHAFRAAAATTVAREAPERVADIPAILGNRTHAITERHYNLATTLDASLRYQELFSQLLEEGEAKPRPLPPRHPR